MKNYFLLLIIAFCLTSIQQVNAQKKQSKNSSVKQTQITTNKGTLTSKSHMYDLVFPQLKEKFDFKNAYIQTQEGKSLKMGDGNIKVHYQYTDSTPTAQSGPITDITQSVSVSNGGRTISISTTTTTKGSGGRITSSTKTTTIDTTTGKVDTKITVSNGQGTPNPGIEIVVKDE